MSRRCCIYGCRSNYDLTSDPVTTFPLPTNEVLRQSWLLHIPKDLAIYDPVVCIKHFEKSALKRCLLKLTGVDPKITTIQLKPNSVPTIFPRHCPDTIMTASRSHQPMSVIHQPTVGSSRQLAMNISHQPTVSNNRPTAVSKNRVRAVSKSRLPALTDSRQLLVSNSRQPLTRGIHHIRDWQGGSVVIPSNSGPIDLPPNPTAQQASLITNPSLRGANMPGFIPVATPRFQDQIRSRNQYLSMYQFTPKMMPMNNSASNPAPVHYTPDVRFKKLPFYDVLAELLKPSTLNVNSPTREHVSNFVFFLTPKQASEISMNREVGPGTRNEYVVQVQMRFCPIEGTGEQDDGLPPGVQVKVNTKLVALPNSGPLANKANEAKRPHKPLNISHLVKLCPSVSNNVIITWNPDYQRGYVVCVNLVRKLSANDLLERLKLRGVKSAEYTTNLIKEKLSDSDNDIATMMLRVSLTCPLGKVRMKTACRSSTCVHLQCFDGGVFLSMNEKRPTWTCPVCGNQAHYETLVVDGYFQDVLDSPLLRDDCTEIQLNNDGSWSAGDGAPASYTISPSKVSVSLDSPKQEVEEINDDDEEEMKVISENGGSHSSEKGDPQAKEKEKEVVVVDLTSTDDEDDAPPPQHSQALSKEIQPPPPATPSLPNKLDHAFSDTSSSLSTRSPSTSIINLDSSPSPSPPLYINPGLPMSSFVCHLRPSDNRYHPY